MTRMPDEHFTQMYAENPDPWGFIDRWFEHRKRALTMGMLPRSRFRSAFEPGCSIGVLTQLLAPRCDSLVATDIVDTALAAARERLAAHPGVTLARWALGEVWRDEVFDLIVLSEVCYYLAPDALQKVLDDAVAHLDPDGVLLAAHWRHPVEGYLMTGNQVHGQLDRHPGLARTARYEDPDVLIETFAPATSPASSVAEREGLVDHPCESNDGNSLAQA